MIRFTEVARIAERLGFHDFGVSRVKPLESTELSDWLSKGYAADMGYMSRNQEIRLNPERLVPNAKSVLSVLLSYNTGDKPVNLIPPKIARYACRDDYHGFFKQKLWQFLDELRKEFGPINGRAFVDSAPVFEREWASMAGLGWVGKNSMLINRNLGSYFFIGELVVDVEVEPSDRVEKNRCGSCTRCIDACPNGAIVEPGVIDSRKCISYITIEKKGLLSNEDIDMLYGWCFGCDICQEVCPWNKKAQKVEDEQGQSSFVGLSASDILEMDEECFNSKFRKSPLLRAGHAKVSDTIAKIIRRKEE